VMIMSQSVVVKLMIAAWQALAALCHAVVHVVAGRCVVAVV